MKWDNSSDVPRGSSSVSDRSDGDRWTKNCTGVGRNILIKKSWIVRLCTLVSAKK